MVGHLNSQFNNIRHEFPLQLIWPLYSEIYVFFLKLCRPSEMPQSMASCRTLHCFIHVWWIYISLDGNF